jgi:deoxyribodipyrimidine photo-lyase
MSNGMTNSLMWFRNDLRVNDNTALYHAGLTQNTIGLVILSPEQWKLHYEAPIKINFYLEHVKALNQQLEVLNIPLHVQIIDHWNDIPEFITNFCIAHNIQNVYANIELGFNENKRDHYVHSLLAKNQIEFHSYHDRTIFPLSTIRNGKNEPYQVFSAFKRKCLEQLVISIPQPLAQPDKQYTRIQTKLNTNLPSFEKLYPQSNLAQLYTAWEVGESKAKLKLLDFNEDKVTDYLLDRDFPNKNATSKLSKYLNIGVLSIRQCLEVLFSESHGNFEIKNEGQATWLNELIWREFYQHLIYDFPHLSKHQPFKSNTTKIVWLESEQNFEAWKFGNTGIPIVDAGMREMLQTGWMHNRVRMITAMFLTKNLLIDWRLGEKWFMQNLIDGDLSANNGGWQWCASTGTDSVPYFRIFNPISQSKKFDPNGEYIRKWVPELAHLDSKTIHEPFEKNDQLELNYPKPIVDLKMSRVRAINAFKSHL